MNTLSKHFGDKRDWFFEARFGLFVHWGLYAIPAWHEQHQYRLRVPRAEYEKLARQWNPTRFDPDTWLDLAQAAGMRYLTFTVKHGDGFCLWNTQQTPFNTMNTPYGKDILALLSQACQRRGVPLCLYYSCVDWHHPSYPNQGRHHELAHPEPGDTPNHAEYLAFVRAQVRELCTEYGAIHGFWWDCNVEEHKDPSLNALIRSLQPGCIINDRGYDAGDFGTPERDYDNNESVLRFARPTEACQSVGAESWGYRRDEAYFTDPFLKRSIARYLARGTNYLLNVGPKADGTIPHEAEGILRRIGAWYGVVEEAFTGGAEPALQLLNGHGASDGIFLTRRRDGDTDTLYLVLTKPIATGTIKLPPIAQPPRSATLLIPGRAPLTWTIELLPSEHTTGRACLCLKDLPVNTPEFTTGVPVIKLVCDAPLSEDTTDKETDPQVDRRAR